MEEIGKIILRLRKQREWTQAELAKKLCVSDKAVSKWENGNGCLKFLNCLCLQKYSA